MAHASPRATKNIEDLRVGDHVVTEASKREENIARGDPASRPWWDTAQINDSWRCVTLTMPAGDKGRFDIVLLRPESWLQATGAKSGASIPFHLPEQGLSGEARGEAVDPCPAIKSGPGQVVTGTFTHVHGAVLSLHIAGFSEPLGVTEDHAIYSLERGKFIPASQFKVNDHLRHFSGDVAITRIERVAGEHRVYNLEVQDHHLYRVTSDGLLVHNGSAAYRKGYEPIEWKPRPVAADALSGTGAAGEGGVFVGGLRAAPKPKPPPFGPLLPNILTKADSILNTVGLKFKPKWMEKVTHKYSWLRNRIPGKKTVIEGSLAEKIAQAQKIILDRVRQGGGEIVNHLGGKAIKYVDGGVSYFFRLDGTFWGIRKNP